MLLAKNLTRIQMKLQCCLYTVPSYPTFHSLNSSNRNGIEMRSCSSLYSIPFATAHDLTTFCSNPVPGESFYKFFQKKKMWSFLFVLTLDGFWQTLSQFLLVSVEWRNNGILLIFAALGILCTTFLDDLIAVRYLFLFTTIIFIGWS